MQKHQLSHWCWKNSINNLSQCQVTTDCQFVKTKQNKTKLSAKQNKVSCACIC